MSISETVRAIDAMPKPNNRHADLVRLSDRLLHQLEALNLRAYAPYQPEQPVPGSRRMVALPRYLAQTINELLVEVGLPVRRMRYTAQALKAVYAAQSVLFHGHPGDENDDVEETQQ